MEVSLPDCGFTWLHPGLHVERAQEMHSKAERFFRKAINAEHNQTPRVINVDKNAAYPLAIDSLTLIPNSSRNYRTTAR